MNKQQNPSLWRWAEDCPVLHPEATKDFILPDSYPDIHRILYTTAECIPGKTVLSGGKLQTDGILRCQVLFADEEGILHETDFQMDYYGQMPYSADEEQTCFAVQTETESITARALNPRKLALRGKVTVFPLLFYRCESNPRLSPELSEMTLEKKLAGFTSWQIDSWSEQGIEAGEDLSLTHEAPMGRLIYNRLNLQVETCNGGEGEIRFSGTGILSLIYSTPEGQLRTADLSFPIQSSVRGDVTTDALCRVTLTPEVVSVVASEDATGEVKGVELDFTYSMQATAAKRSTAVYPIDCYAIDAPTRVEEERVVLLGELREISREYSQTMEGDSDGMTELLRGYAKVYTDSREQTQRGTLLHLTAQVTLVGKDKENLPMSLQLVEHFTMECDAPRVGWETFSATPSVLIDGDCVKIRLQGRMDAYAMKAEEATYVGAVLPTEDRLSSAKDSMTLCYPAPGETLWQIAKRYRTTERALLAANSLGEGELPPVLLVPRG